MKRIIAIAISLLMLTACTAPPTQGTPASVSTDLPQPNLPNPASAYCEQTGGQLEIVTASDGNQSGVCIFPNGGSCDEWAYYRGECAPVAVESTTHGDNPGSIMPPGATEDVADWWGVVKRTKPGAQFDDYFERQDLGQVMYYGIDSMDPIVKSQIEALCDSGRIVHIYGTLFSNVPDYNGSQILVARVEIDE